MRENFKNYLEKKSMKLVLNVFLFLFPLLFFSEKSYSLSDYKIKRICLKEKNKSACIKNLKEIRSNLQKGNLIEIPVIPFKR